MIDPVTLAVLNGRLEQIADEMDATLFRSAFNPIIAEAHDASHGLYDAETGELHDFYDHTQDPDLSLVSLESSEYEYQQTTPIYSSVVATTERGGSMGMLLLIGVLAFAMFRRGY